MRWPSGTRENEIRSGSEDKQRTISPSVLSSNFSAEALTYPGSPQYQATNNCTGSRTIILRFPVRWNLRPEPSSLQESRFLDDLPPHQQSFAITVTIRRAPERASFLGLERCLNSSSAYVESGDREVIISEAPFVVLHGSVNATKPTSSNPC